MGSRIIRPSSRYTGPCGDSRPAAEIFAGIERKATQSLGYQARINDLLDAILEEKSDLSVDGKIEMIRRTVVEWLSNHLAT